MTPAQLADSVRTAAAAVLTDRDLDPSVLPAVAGVDRPRDPGHGDYASNLALQVASRTGLPPRDMAQAIADKLISDPAIQSVEVAGPGFLNIRLGPAAVGAVAGLVIAQGRAYGHGTLLADQRVNLEFISANPTGPIHIGGVRWAAVGDALARLLRAQGATVSTEYYFNDAGAQIDRFADSLLAAARQQAPPSDGYVGEYIAEIAGAVVSRHPDVLGWRDDDAQQIFRREGVALMLDEIKTSLAEFGVHFDVYFQEKELRSRGELDTALARLRQAGHVYEAEGATWVRTTDFGDDKDRVYIRGNGDFTYFAADCAYYLDKRARGFGKIVIILGADHHGYVGRLRAIAACFGDDPDQTLEILIGQLVNLIRDGQPVRMSKRTGTVVTIDDIVDAIGVDAARYALARYSLDSPVDLDLDLWTRRSNDNPVYYVQYAHARITSLLRAAAESGITRGGDYDPGLLSHVRENDLLKALADFPGVVASAAELRQPHRVARYLEDLAGAYHRFYDSCRVLPRDGEPAGDLTRSRLWLAGAARIVLANGLGLLGVTAPDKL
ncbi:MAG TPA: arginine--tRNA ligase [Streptosporangiaceae bacterium]|nr:arginine--tRNA ligase [Streptosporangiaceae bacterium]